MSAPAKSSRAPADRRDGRAQDNFRLHEALFREVNERTVSLQASALDDTLVVVCECRSVECNAEIPVTAVEYEAVRRFPTRFLVKRGHERDEDRVVSEGNDSVVVEKSGTAGMIAVRTDPRRRRPLTKAYVPGPADASAAEDAHARR
jgi:hypothetical protein